MIFYRNKVWGKKMVILIINNNIKLYNYRGAQNFMGEIIRNF